MIVVRLGILGVLALAIGLAWIGAETVYYFHGRPLDLARMAQQSNVDLANASGSLTALEQAVGPPNKPTRGGTAANADDYSWYHDRALRAVVLDGAVASIEFGLPHKLYVLPYKRPPFPGSFLGLRIGGPEPTAAQAEAIRARAAACCDAQSLTWDVKDGRIVLVHFDRSGFSYRYVDHPPG